MANKKFLKVQKSNTLNQANFSDFSLSCYRVLLNLITKIQRNDIYGEPLPADSVSRICSLSVAEYAKEFNIEPDNAYTILKEATDKMMKTSFSIQKGIDVLKINVCSQAYYRKSQGKIDIEFTPNIMPHLAELTGNFTMYNLNEIAGFDSIYTTRLYELIMQFKTTGKIEVTVEDLRFKLGCVNKFKQYYDFKTKTFAHAMAEINQQWTLNIKCEEIKTGKTVTDLVFTFKSTFIRKAYDPVRQKMRSQLIRPRRKTKIEIEKKTESTSSPIKPSKQELLNIKETESVISKVKATALKVADVALKVATTPEVYQSIKDGTPILDGAQKTRARREKTVKDTTRRIIDALINAKNITEEEAKVFAIENGLI